MTRPARDTTTRALMRVRTPAPPPDPKEPPMHPITDTQLTPAEIRLAQYGERTSTWSTATYNDGTEKALHEIALGLKAEVDRLRAELDDRSEALASADDPTPLRWGLNDVLWGDDDTVTVLLSGPNGEPYWLELDPERAAVLRQDLAGPDGA
jgi:hypothetical protein